MYSRSVFCKKFRVQSFFSPNKNLFLNIPGVGMTVTIHLQGNQSKRKSTVTYRHLEILRPKRTVIFRRQE